MQPDRVNPKAMPIDPEVVRAARAAKHGIAWLAVKIAVLLEDSLSIDRKSRQAKRKNGPSKG